MAKITAKSGRNFILLDAVEGPVSMFSASYCLALHVLAG
jgi:hypothetical protein